MWIVRFAGNHWSQSDALSNMKEINERRERSPLRRWVLIQELPGIRMGRGRVRGRVGGGGEKGGREVGIEGWELI